MTVWDTNRMMGWSTKAVIAAVVLAVLLVAAVPVAFVAGVILMLFGHIIVGHGDAVEVSAIPVAFAPAAASTTTNKRSAPSRSRGRLLPWP